MRPDSRASSSRGSNTLRELSPTVTNSSFHVSPKLSGPPHILDKNHPSSRSVYSLDVPSRHAWSPSYTDQRIVPRVPSEWGSSQATLVPSPPPFERFLNWNPLVNPPSSRYGDIQWPGPLPESRPHSSALTTTTSQMVMNPAFEPRYIEHDLFYPPNPASRFMSEFAFKPHDKAYSIRSTRIFFAGYPHWGIVINDAYSIKIFDFIMLLVTYLSGPDGARRSTQSNAREFQTPQSSQLLMYQNHGIRESKAKSFHNGQTRIDVLGRGRIFHCLQEDAARQGWIVQFANCVN